LKTLADVQPEIPQAGRAATRGRRSPALQTVLLVFLAAAGGAATGAVVARQATKPSGSAARSATAEHLAAPDVAGIAARIAPAVVSIRTRPAHIGELFQSQPAAGEGTGIVINADGTIVTDAVLVAGTRPITVGLADGRSLPATVIGRDAASGIAVLKVAARGLPVARLAGSDQSDRTDRLRVGDDVVALGDAFALPSGPIVSRGTVAALDRTVAMPSSTTRPARLTGVLEVTNVLGASYAGGPVVDSDGDVVGIATAAADGNQPPGFAIDVARVGAVIQAIEGGRAPTDALGVEAIDVTPALAQGYGLPVESGALVAAVVPGSPALEAGLRADDIVVRLGHERVATAEDLARATHDPAVTSVRLSVVRGTRSLTLEVRLRGG
jgi:serine protease Do